MKSELGELLNIIERPAMIATITTRTRLLNLFNGESLRGAHGHVHHDDAHLLFFQDD